MNSVEVASSALNVVFFIVIVVLVSFEFSFALIGAAFNVVIFESAMLIFAVVVFITTMPPLLVAFDVSKLQPVILILTTFASDALSFPVRKIAQPVLPSFSPWPATDIVASTPSRLRVVTSSVSKTLIKAYQYLEPAVALIVTSLRFTVPAFVICTTLPLFLWASVMCFNVTLFPTINAFPPPLVVIVFPFPSIVIVFPCSLQTSYVLMV